MTLLGPTLRRPPRRSAALAGPPSNAAENARLFLELPMHTTFHLSESTLIQDTIGWFRSLHKHVGRVRTPDGDEFLVLRPEQLADLDAILSDPALFEALDSGVGDARAGRAMNVSGAETLRASLDAATPCDPAMVKAVESGIADVLNGRTIPLKAGESLGNARRRREQH